MKIRVLLFLTITLLTATNSLHAQGTAFTYQGRLNDGASGANGIFDVRFAIYDAQTFGTQQGPILTNAATAVSSGLFTVTLDFGNQFPGANRWLEIGVRTNGNGAFTALAPRQLLTPSPYAIYSANAGSAGSVAAANITGTVMDARLSANVALRAGGNAFAGNQTFTDGSVGIGTTTPSATLDVAGAIRADYLLLNPVDAAMEGGEILLKGAAAFPDWAMDVSSSALRFHTVGGVKLQIDPMAGMTVMGNVGIGTPATLGSSLEVAGGLHVRGGAPGALGVNNNGYAFSGNDGDNDSGMFSSADGQVEFYGNSVERMRIASSGGVGIGTANPVGALQVVGTVTATAFSGTDNQPLEFYANGRRGLRLEPTSSGFMNVIGGSADNFVGAGVEGATIGGGNGNTIQSWAHNSTIGGGFGNTVQANGEYATIPGGYNNSAARYAFAAGCGAKANHQGAFVWADTSGFFPNELASATNDSVTMRAAGGYRRFSNSDTTAGVKLAAGSTAWSVISDRNVKKDFAAVNSVQILEKLAAMPITQWHYQWENSDVTPHIGPMAQDFKAAFYPGTDDKSITTQEADGVALAAIQGLNQKLEETRAENAELKQQLSELKQLVQTLVPKH